MLGRHIRALANNVSKELREGAGGLNIVCVGSVWKSWDLLKDGFLEGIKNNNGQPVSYLNLYSSKILKNLLFQCISELTMVKLSVGMATGATYLGAKAAGKSIPKTFQKNVEKFFHFKS